MLIGVLLLPLFLIGLYFCVALSWWAVCDLASQGFFHVLAGIFIVIAIWIAVSDWRFRRHARLAKKTSAGV